MISPGDHTEPAQNENSFYQRSRIDLAAESQALCRNVAFDFASLFQFIRAWVTERPLTPRRLGVIVAFCLLFPIFEILIWSGLILDHLFFPGHRSQAVRTPVFIVGNFRSGTTFLHRLMAKDTSRFATMKMWEILFAPSLTMRTVLRAIISVQRFVGGLGNRWMQHLEAGWHEKNKTHQVSLSEPEEDDYLLLHVFSTLTVGLASGLTRLARRYAHFDQELSPDERSRIMDFYKNCVRRHLYGSANPQLSYLAKNPALTPKLKTVREHFPDAKFIVLVRDPAEMLGSAASMMQMTWRAVGAGEIDSARREFLLDTTAHWYRYPSQFGLSKDQMVSVKYEDLVRDSAGTVREIYAALGYTITEDFSAILTAEAQKAAEYRSRHKHTLEGAGFDPAQVQRAFGKPSSR